MNHRPQESFHTRPAPRRPPNTLGENHMRIARHALTVAAALGCAAGIASADILVYTAALDGPSESPPNASPGVGTATLTIDTTARTFRLVTSFSGLLGTVTAAHIHGPTAVPFAGTASVMTQTPTFSGFPSGVTFGSYDMTFDMTQTGSWNGSFVTGNGGTAAGAETAFMNAVAQGRAYLNIHTTSFGGGEIRGFFVPTPGVTALLGLAGLAGVRRRR